MEQLRRLCTVGTFSILQEKLERWLRDYSINSTDLNMARAVEIIELNARVQGQLFKLLSVCASEGGVYGGAAAIKLRLLPLLGSGFFASGISTDTSLGILEDVGRKHREFSDLQRTYDESLDKLELDLKEKEAENQELVSELEETKLEMDRIARQSTSEKMFSEAEIRDLKTKLLTQQSENDRLRTRLTIAESSNERERAIRAASVLRASSPLPITVPITVPIGTSVVDGHSTLALPRAGSPLLLEDPVQRVRQQALVTRFGELYAVNRLDAQDILRKFTGDYENIQRIIFATLMESFTVAKLHFRDYKSRVRSDVIRTHIGPDTLEEAVQNYINRNGDFYDQTMMVQDVLRALRRNPRLHLPADVDYEVLAHFVRESVKFAWESNALAHPLDVAIAFDAELFEDNKYRRSFDSEYSAPLVSHHIWPALIQDGRVLVKGEACTRHGASLSGTKSARDIVDYGYRSVSPRARSPIRTFSSMSRARSPSPLQLPLPAVGRASRLGATSVVSARSVSPARSARTVSTSLSHYLDR